MRDILFVTQQGGGDSPSCVYVCFKSCVIEQKKENILSSRIWVISQTQKKSFTSFWQMNWVCQTHTHCCSLQQDACVKLKTNQICAREMLQRSAAHKTPKPQSWVFPDNKQMLYNTLNHTCNLNKTPDLPSYSTCFLLLKFFMLI